MDAKIDHSHSTSEKAASTGSEVERQTGLENDVESSAEIDGKAVQEITEKAKNDPNVVDWDGEKDPPNPLNWTKKKKRVNVGLLSLMTLITPLASSLFAPAVPQVMKEFKEADSTVASFVVSIYVLGYATGLVLLAPLSEIYGRGS
ncbi:Major facilitator superfamily [Venturia nashicola]|uniref:Major facilitator superfamily n=1 Tax=Venturia nashicola TaxID=86259 RepID=A0A4Z1NTH1_9PEZI|nr:Major facilitator superfamily [Venturia nashicola]